MIKRKSEREIDIMRIAGEIVAKTHEELKKHADYIAKPVYEDGIYNACKDLGLI